MPEKIENNKRSGETESRIQEKNNKIGVFPSEQSLLRLVVTIMMDINEEWITGRKYMNMEAD